MKGNASAAQAITSNERPLSPRVQEARGELVGVAQEGLLALSVGVGLGVLAELMEEEGSEVVGPKGRRAPRPRGRRGHPRGPPGRHRAPAGAGHRRGLCRHECRCLLCLVAFVAFSVDPSQQPQRDLHALGGDPKTHAVSALFQLDPVEHQHRQPDIAQAGGPSTRLRPSRVRSTNARETADFNLDRATCSISVPTGSPVPAHRRVESDAKHPLQHHATTDHDTRNAHTSTSPT